MSNEYGAPERPGSPAPRTLPRTDHQHSTGRLIYSFDLTVAGQPGLYEVEIDAVTGAVVRVAREP